MRPRFKIPANVRYAMTVVVLLLAMNFVLRLAFLGYNFAHANEVPRSEILLSFLIGVRFDLATIFIFNGLILLFLSLPFPFITSWRTYRVCNILIVLANAPVLVVNSIDVVYYGFSEKRLTHELFTTKSDYQSFKPEMLMEWWYLFALFFIMVFVFHRTLTHFAHKHQTHLQALASTGKLPKKRYWIGVTVFALAMYTGIRGGMQQTPLWSGQAFVGANIFTGNLGMNSAFTVVKSLDLRQERPVHLVPETDALPLVQSMVKNTFDSEFPSRTFPFVRQARFTAPENRYNVVLLIIESLNARQVGCIAGQPLAQSLTPNLDTLVRHGRMYRNFYANGTRSVEAIPALLNSMPEIFRRPTIGSRYVDNHHYGLPFMLAERGYTNAFFCGAHNGTMSFDQYAETSGIENYYGMNEYPHAERDFNGYWGCDDGPILKWMGELQDQFSEPFFTTFFSISNHHPFHLPKALTEDIAKMPLTDMEKTIRYTDRVLGRYFAQVRGYDWFENTIFIVTGDHCFHTKKESDRTVMDDFHVPLFLMGPGISPGFDDRLGSHVSILPTLIECLRLNTWHSSTAISLLDSTKTPYVINNLMGMRTLAHKDLAYSTNFEKPLAVHEMVQGRWKKVDILKGLKTEKWRKMDLKLRSLYQELLNTRIENRLQVRETDGFSQAN